MAPKYLKIAPAIFLVLAICGLMVLPGCNSIIQPGRDDLAGASYFLCDSPLGVEIRMILSSEKTEMSYSSTVSVQDSNASWDGIAKVKWNGVAWEQECQSKCDGTISAKHWRGRWVATENRSPVEQLRVWLQEVESGSGTYPKRPTTPAQHHDLLSDVNCETYSITLSGMVIQWDALCDVHPDSLFGGQGLLTQFVTATVTLFFGTEDLILKAALVSAATESGAMDLVVKLTPATAGPVLELDTLEIAQGYPHEEWNFPEGE